MKKESYRYQEEQFKHDLCESFNLSRKHALSTMKNEEHKQFSKMQIDDPWSASMAGVDKRLAEKEARQNAQIKVATARKTKKGHPAALNN